MLTLPRLLTLRIGRISPHLRRAACLYRQRNALAKLDDHMLADIGVSRGEALRESERAIWDVPSTWRN